MSKEKQRRIVDQKKKELVEDAISQNYSVLKLIEEKQLGELDGKKMACPFHEDLSPSMFVDTGMNIWKCHSCGRGGGYVSLYQHWANELQGMRYTYYEAMDAILKSDSRLKDYVGSVSIFERQKEKLELKPITQLPKIKRRKPIYGYQSTHETILKNLVKQKDFEGILDAIGIMQKGRTADAVNASINLQKVEDGFSLEELLQTYNQL